MASSGILEEDGRVIHPATGTPQGGIISPVLANIYLHYALDLWFERCVKKQCRGDVTMIRFADDFVCAFEHQVDAERFESQLGQRLARFGLTVEPEKTRTLSFHPGTPEEAFDFLGFEFRWVRRRSGRMGVRRRTSPGKLRSSQRAFTEWIRDNRNSRISVLMNTLRHKLRGYWNYYGVRGNGESLSRFYHQCQRILFKWLNRRSQKRSYTWAQFASLMRRYAIPPPRIVEPHFQPSFSPAMSVRGDLRRRARCENTARRDL